MDDGEALKKTLGQRARLRRAALLGRAGRPLSQRELAQRMGLSQPAYNGIEKGESWPEAGNLAALARELHVSIGWLLGDDVSQDEVDVGRWVLALPPSLRGALLLSASDRPDVPAPPPALTDGPAAPVPSQPTAEPAPPPPPASDPAEDEAPRRTASTRTRRGG